MNVPGGKEVGRYIQPFRNNTSVWHTDRQTDRETTLEIKLCWMVFAVTIHRWISFTPGPPGAFSSSSHHFKFQ